MLKQNDEIKNMTPNLKRKLTSNSESEVEVQDLKRPRTVDNNKTKSNTNEFPVNTNEDDAIVEKSTVSKLIQQIEIHDVKEDVRYVVGNDTQLEKCASHANDKISTEVDSNIGDNVKKVASAYDFVHPLIEKDYLMDNLQDLHQREKTSFPNPNYLRSHPIDNRKRSILVDWLVEMTHKTSFKQETLFLAVCYIDRYLSQASIKVNELQLLGVTALLITCMYKELRSEHLHVNECVFLTNNMYTRAQIYDMELRILTVLRFDVGTPTTSTFMDIFSGLCDMERVEMAVTRYIAELSLLQGGKMLRFLPSMRAASALLLGSCAVNEIKPKPSELALSKPFGYTMDELRPCMEELAELHRRAPYAKLRVVRVKYSEELYYCVSTLAVPY